MDEVFGSENFVTSDHLRKTTTVRAPSDRRLPSVSDYLALVREDRDAVEVPTALRAEELGGEAVD